MYDMSEALFFNQMKYQNALPLMYGMRDYFERKDKNGRLYFPSFLETKIRNASGSFMTDIPKKQRIKNLRKNVCSFCGSTDLPESTEGDHILSKSLHPGVDLDAYTVLCCVSCNSSKLNHDLLEWWIDKQEKKFDDIPIEVIGIYVRAEWKWRYEEGKLNEPITKFFKTGLEHLRQRIMNDNSKKNEHNKEIFEKHVDAALEKYLKPDPLHDQKITDFN